MDLITTFLVKQGDIGFHNNLFGGHLLSYLDSSGAAYAAEKCHTANLVTASMEKVNFVAPIKAGRIVKIYGEIERIGRTSVTLKLEARSLNVHTGQEKLVCETQITFVRIDDEGSPIPIIKNY